MRLVIANPHIQPFSHTVASIVFRRRSIDKYRYFIDEFIQSSKYKTAFYIDGTRSSFNTLGIRFQIFPKLFTYIELLIWMGIHRINPFHHAVYFSTKRLHPNSDIIFNFSNSTIDGEQVPINSLEMHRFQGIIATHLSHYFIGTKAITAYLKTLPHNLLVAESNLANNQFFQHYMPNLQKTHILPFVVKPRYRNNTNVFKSRINKCFAVGTLFEPKSQEYKDFFGNTPFHPMRQAIYSNQDKLKDVIDSFINSLNKTIDLKQIHPEDSLTIRLAKRYLPYVLLENLVPNHKNTYFSFDIVAKYNAYRMFISPEEIIGLPSINAIEGMACGAAFIGIDHPMYIDIGLIPNVHYIAYKNQNLEDLVQRIQYYQQYPEECEKIAQAGYQFVSSNFTPEAVAKRLWESLGLELSDLNVGLNTRT